ncbi:hypothetical protein LSH36_38g03055 [Paralvinella palmiformis]|uniref:Cytochrome c oxidase assembly factor 5 n=1 Tax=Paralvinella palmiformis TaxID=53620 RepID=A0AAD9K875_9ANNE|nr:hypothetical protein LSH36_38g03055 [Paralvinella palmiformis]
MPKYYPDEDDKPKKPGRACQGIRDDLKECLLNSKCVKEDKKTPKECLLLGHHPSVPLECQNLRMAMYECKRSLVDMRMRFRGRKGE